MQTIFSCINSGLKLNFCENKKVLGRAAFVLALNSDNDNIVHTDRHRSLYILYSIGEKVNRLWTTNILSSDTPSFSKDKICKVQSWKIMLCSSTLTTLYKYQQKTVTLRIEAMPKKGLMTRPLNHIQSSKDQIFKYFLNNVLDCSKNFQSKPWKMFLGWKVRYSCLGAIMMPMPPSHTNIS